MTRVRFFRKNQARITKQNSILLGCLVLQEAKRLTRLKRSAFVTNFVENSYGGQGEDWKDFFSQIATRSVGQLLADGKLKAYAVSEDETDVRIISKRYWKTKDNRLNVAAIANRMFAVSLGEELDPHAPDTLLDPVAPDKLNGAPMSKTSIGYNLFVTKTNLDEWQRRTDLSIDGLVWDQSTLQSWYDEIPRDLQATMSNAKLTTAAEGSGVTVRQVRALRRSVRPPRGPKLGRDK